MKNVTVSMDDDTYRRARLKAVEMDKSLSALVREYLDTLGSGETEFERLARQEREVRAELAKAAIPFSAADRLSREDLYDRARARREAAESARG